MGDRIRFLSYMSGVGEISNEDAAEVRCIHDLQRRAREDCGLPRDQHLAVDIDLSVDETGGVKLTSGAQRFYQGVIGFSFPLFFSGIANVREWYDDSIQKYRIEVNVHNRTWGPLFGYRGSFEAEWLLDVERIPQELQPIRFERRE